MALFRRDSPNPSEANDSPSRDRRVSSPPSRGGASTLIAAGSKLSGTLTGSTDILIDGELEGGIDVSAAIVIGEGGRVKGDLSCRTARVAGRVVGNVVGSEIIELLPSGAVEGNLKAARVVIAEGAYLKGQVEMSDERGGPSAARSPAREPNKK